MLGERKRLMNDAIGQNVMKWWFLSAIQGVQQNALQGFQNLFNEIFKDTLTSIR
jgi:hypothetical protein